MIGARIEGQPGFPVAAAFWLACAAAFGVAAVIVGNPHLGIFAVLPALIVRPRPHRYGLHEGPIRGRFRSHAIRAARAARSSWRTQPAGAVTA